MPIIARSGGTDKYIVGRQYRAPRQLTASKAIETPADLNGVKLRVPETTFYLKVWGGLGAITTPVNWSEVFTALQTHVVDAQENPIEIYYAAGRIHYLSMSSHNPIVALEAVKSGHLDALLFSINPCYDLLPGNEDCETLWADESYEKPLFNLDPVREELYETCQRLGVGITVMKAFGGGDLPSEEYSPAGKAMTAVECLHYALTRPAVASVMCGAKSLDDLKASLAYETASDEEKDYAATFASFPKISWKGYCMYCGHCAPCPVGIDVADVTKFLNLTKAQKMVPETVAQHYSVLKAHGGDCIGCGSVSGHAAARSLWQSAIRSSMSPNALPGSGPRWRNASTRLRAS